MATEKTKILIEVQANQKAVDDLRAAITKLREERKRLNKELKDAVKDGDIKKQKQLTAAINDTTNQIDKLNKEYKEANRDLKINQQIAESATGSYNQLTAQLAKNKIAWKNLSQAERENSDVGKKLTADQHKIITQ